MASNSFPAADFIPETNSCAFVEEIFEEADMEVFSFSKKTFSSAFPVYFFSRLEMNDMTSLEVSVSTCFTDVVDELLDSLLSDEALPVLDSLLPEEALPFPVVLVVSEPDGLAVGLTDFPPVVSENLAPADSFVLEEAEPEAELSPLA